MKKGSGVRESVHDGDSDRAKFDFIQGRLEEIENQCRSKPVADKVAKALDVEIALLYSDLKLTGRDIELMTKVMKIINAGSRSEQYKKLEAKLTA